MCQVCEKNETQTVDCETNIPIKPNLNFFRLIKIALANLKGNIWKSFVIIFGTGLLSQIICLLLEKIPAPKGLLPLLFNILVSPILYTSIICFFLILGKKEKTSITEAFDTPSKSYFRFIWMNIRVTLFTLLWSLLFIIPGIIAALRYSLTPFVMLDDPQINAKDAMKQSAFLIKGYKLKFFLYTLGISVLWCIIITLLAVLFALLAFANKLLVITLMVAIILITTFLWVVMLLSGLTTYYIEISRFKEASSNSLDS